MLIFPCWSISQDPPFSHLCRRKSLWIVFPWEMGIILQWIKKIPWATSSHSDKGTEHVCKDRSVDSKTTSLLNLNTVLILNSHVAEEIFLCVYLFSLTRISYKVINPPLSLSGKEPWTKPLENKEFNGSLVSINKTCKPNADVPAQTSPSSLLPTSYPVDNRPG